MRAPKVTLNHDHPESSPSPAGPVRRVPVSPTKRRGLDPKTLATLPPGDHNDGAGLVLRVFPTGARTWMLRYRPKAGTKRGPQRRLRLGELGGPLALDVSALQLGERFRAPGELTLSAAREVGKALSGLAASGVDPMELLTVADRNRRAREDEAAKRKAEGTLTVGTLLDRFLAAREDVRPNTRKLWRSLTRAAIKPAFGDRDPRELTRGEVKSWHRATGESGRKTWANRAVELLKGAYGWAVEDELLPASPVVGIKAFDERSRSRVLTSDEIHAVLQAIEFEPFGDVFRLLFWTGARRSEVTEMTWAEVDLRAKVWRLPADRAKTGASRTLPLSAPALKLLQARREADPKGRWVFPSPVAAVGALRSIAAPFRRIVKRSGVGEWTVHDIRRTVRTNLAALGVRPDIAEAVLGHVRPRIERTYNVHEPIAEMATALEAWARRLDAIASGEPEAANVVTFAR
jgi:integrase